MNQNLPKQWTIGKYTLFAIMLFILSLFLIGMGVFLGTVTAHYPAFYGGREYHPYEGSSTFLTVVGIIILACALILTFVGRRNKQQIIP